MEKKSFLSSLFDLSFDSFLTTKIIKLIFLLMIAGAVIYALVGSFAALALMFRGAFVQGFFGLLMALFSGLVACIAARVYCELIIVIFRISENLKELVWLQKEKSAPVTVSTPSSVLKRSR